MCRTLIVASSVHSNLTSFPTFLQIAAQPTSLSAYFQFRKRCPHTYKSETFIFGCCYDTGLTNSPHSDTKRINIIISVCSKPRPSQHLSTQSKPLIAPVMHFFSFGPVSIGRTPSITPFERFRKWFEALTIPFKRATLASPSQSLRCSILRKVKQRHSPNLIAIYCFSIPSLLTTASHSHIKMFHSPFHPKSHWPKHTFKGQD